jgi:hypothetical protein
MNKSGNGDLPTQSGACPCSMLVLSVIFCGAVEPWSLPQDMVTEVPSVTRYKFFRAGNTIAVVDPNNRKIIQVIKN